MPAATGWCRGPGPRAAVPGGAGAHAEGLTTMLHSAVGKRWPAAATHLASRLELYLMVPCGLP